MASDDIVLNRAELEQLTGYEQPKRMCAWLTVHQWVFEQPKRRGELPRVGRAYFLARMSGQAMQSAEPAREGPRLDHFFAPA